MRKSLRMFVTVVAVIVLLAVLPGVASAAPCPACEMDGDGLYFR